MSQPILEGTQLLWVSAYRRTGKKKDIGGHTSWASVKDLKKPILLRK